MSTKNELVASQKLLSLMEQANQNAESLLDDFPSVFLIINKNYQVVRSNKAFCDLVSQAQCDILHLNFVDIFDDDNKRIAKHHLSALRQKDIDVNKVQFRADAKKSDSKSLQYLWTIVPLFEAKSSDGELFTIIGKDCSSIYESEIKLTGIFESLPIGILVLDNDIRVREILTHYTDVLLETTEILNKKFDEIIDAADEHYKRDLFNTVKRLKNCVGHSMPRFIEVETYLLSSVGIKSLNTHSTKWLKISYQPIIKNGVIDSFMLIIQDDTDAVKVANERKRIDDLERQSRELYECAIRDPLTGLYTRLYMQDGFNTLLSGLKYGNIKAVELVIFDIDNFKRINDTLGHIVGDEVISMIGKIIKEHCYAGNIAVRYGGDEFLVMLPEEHQGNHLGTFFAENVRAEAEKLMLDMDNGQNLPVTISGGVIQCSAGETIEQLIKRADEYLYQAKDAGKNTIMSESKLRNGKRL